MTENKSQQVSLLEEIEAKLSRVVDPETGMNVLSIGLVRDIRSDGGNVSLTLKPASAICPMAFKLGCLIRDAISCIPGVRDLSIRVENYIRAAELEALLNERSSQKGVSDADI